MDVNKIKILNNVGNKEIILPLSTNWDLSNREDAIVDEQTKIVKEIIGKPLNYELQRFSRIKVGQSTAQTYEFNFFNTGTTIWESTYLNRFSERAVRYTRGEFSKSFFKLDLYDTQDPKKQKIYLSIILPTSNSTELTSDGTSNCQAYNFFKVVGPQSPPNLVGTVNFTDCCGVKQSIIATSTSYGCLDESQPVFFTGYSFINLGLTYQEAPIYLHGEGTNTLIDAINLNTCECIPDIIPPAEPPNLTYPNFYLDHFGNQEGYYIYWYQDESLINLSDFYMTAKFFDASNCTYTKFTTTPQSQTTIPNNDLYYRVILDYSNKLYKITNLTDLVPVVNASWYEYVNPKIN